MNGATQTLARGGASRPRRRQASPAAGAGAGAAVDRVVGIVLAGAVLALGFAVCAFFA